MKIQVKQIALGFAILVPAVVFAQAPTVASVTTSLSTSMISALGDIITNVAPLLAFAFGIAAAVRWVKMGTKSK